jgi:hypothetical protein
MRVATIPHAPIQPGDKFHEVEKYTPCTNSRNNKRKGKKKESEKVKKVMLTWKRKLLFSILNYIKATAPEKLPDFFHSSFTAQSSGL